MVDGLADPGAFKLIHMAMQFHKGAAEGCDPEGQQSPEEDCEGFDHLGTT
jgi:hypothetical protein